MKSTHDGESSDIELPVMFEYDNWWLDAEKPMTDDCLAAFLKKHFWENELNHEKIITEKTLNVNFSYEPAHFLFDKWS